MTDATPASASRPRRSFLVELLAVAVGATITLAGLVIGLIPFFDPMRRNRSVPYKYREATGVGREGYVQVASLASIPEDGSPQMFPVRADRIDAWNYDPAEPVGAVFLRRLEAGGSQVECLHATCPHLGCTIGYSAPGGVFRCPCHDSLFELDGARIDQPGRVNPSPRRMDALEVDQEALDEAGEVWVRFVNYRTGQEGKIPIE